MPKWLGGLSLVGLFASTFLYQTGDEKAQMFASILLFICIIIVIGDAFILITIYGKRTNRKFLPTYAMIALILLPTVLIYAFIGLGLLDCFTDIRKRIEIITI